MLEIIDFTENYLPNELIHNSNNKYTIQSDENEIISKIDNLWTQYKTINNIEESSNLEYTVRRNRNKFNGQLEKMILIKTQRPNEEDLSVSAVIYINDSNKERYFALHELEEKILPKTYVKNNLKYVLLESDVSSHLKNWGKILNPYDLSDIVLSISLVTQ